MKMTVFSMPTWDEILGITQGEFLRALVDHLASADDLGFDGIWVNEHHFHAFGGMAPSLTAILSALSTKTRRVRLGASTVLLPLYHPLQVAEQFAMVDLMSGGRLEFGVGRGFVAHDYDVLGIPLEEARERMNESLDIVLQAWTGKPFSYDGRFYRFQNVEVWPAPEQQPHPPVWVAATANPESFEWIAQQGHHLLTIAFARKIEHLSMCTRVYRDAWAAAGHDPTAYEIGTHYHVVVGEDGNEARRTAERATTRRVQSTYQAQALSTASAWGGYETFSVEQLVDEGRMIAGDPEECAALIRRNQRELGFTWLNSTFQFGDITFERAQHSMDLFAAEVMPRLAAAEAPALAERA